MSEELDQWEWVRSRLSTLYKVGLISEDVYQEVDNAIDKKLTEMGININEDEI